MKTTTKKLITVPTQIFEQGELGYSDYELPIQFQAYNDTITLEQDGRTVLINLDALEAFIKSLRQFKKECYPMNL